MPGRGKFLTTWYTTRHREPEPRIICPACLGVPDINETGWCDYCTGRGYFDEHNPPPGR